MDSLASRIGSIAKVGAQQALSATSTSQVLDSAFQDATRSAKQEIDRLAASAAGVSSVQTAVKVPSSSSSSAPSTAKKPATQLANGNQPLDTRPGAGSAAGAGAAGGSVAPGAAGVADVPQNFLPPGSDDEASEIQAQLDQEARDALLKQAREQGPAALIKRDVDQVVNVPGDAGSVTAVGSSTSGGAAGSSGSSGSSGVSGTGAKPAATSLGSAREAGSGFAGGTIIESSTKYDPKGLEAQDSIDASAVDAVAGDESGISTGEAIVYGTLGVAALVGLVLLVQKVMRDRKELEKKTMIK